MSGHLCFFLYCDSHGIMIELMMAPFALHFKSPTLSLTSLTLLVFLWFSSLFPSSDLSVISLPLFLFTLPLVPFGSQRRCLSLERSRLNACAWSEVSCWRRPLFRIPLLQECRGRTCPAGGDRQPMSGCGWQFNRFYQRWPGKLYLCVQIRSGCITKFS